MKRSVSPEVKEEIQRRLRVAESEQGIRILYACESGSRAWGFASPDSDYDVRFIYVHPVDWYLSFDVERKRDVIEYPIVDEIDCGGWDVRKALHLFSRTNGALLEWLKSPIKYVESGPFAERLRRMENRAANRKALCYHYSHMARGNAREYLSELGLGPPIAEINDFISSEIERHGESFKGQGRPDIQEGLEIRAELNRLFREVVRV